jgi:hypothetical protein
MLALALALAWRVERFRSLLDAQGTGFLRVYLWQSAWQMARDHPILGVGLDQFLYQYPRYMHPEAWREPGLSHPHNLVLDFWLRLGLLGLGFLAWATWRLIGRTRMALAGAVLTGTAGVHPAGEAAAGGPRPIPASSSTTRPFPAAAIAAAVRAEGPGWSVPRYVLALGGAGALVASLLHGLVDNSYFVMDLAYAFWTMALILELAGER